MRPDRDAELVVCPECGDWVWTLPCPAPHALATPSNGPEASRRRLDQIQTLGAEIGRLSREIQTLGDLRVRLERERDERLERFRLLDEEAW